MRGGERERERERERESRPDINISRLGILQIIEFMDNGFVSSF